MRLENWLLASEPYADYAAPGSRDLRLAGEAHGDSRRADGTGIVTSRITKFDWARGLATTETGSQYVLGEPDTHWLLWLHAKGLSLKAYGWAGCQIVTGNGADVPEPDPED